MDAVKKGKLLLLATFINHRRLECRRLILNRGPAPARNATENLQTLRSDIDSHLSLRGEGLRVIVFSRTTFEHDQIAPSGAFRWILDEERHAFDLYVAEFIELHATTLGPWAGKDAVATVGSEGIGQVQDPELLGRITNNEREDVSKRLGAKSIETFRHQTPLSVLPLLNVTLRDLTHTDLRGKRNRGAVFTRDHTLQHLTLLRGHIECPKTRIHFPVRVHNVNQQLRRPMRAHAIQRRPNSNADVSQLVTNRASRREEHFPSCRIPRLLNFRHQFRNDRVFGGVIDLEQLIRPLRDLLVRMRPQPRNIPRRKNNAINATSLHSIEQSSRGLRAFEHGLEGLRLLFTLQRTKSGHNSLHASAFVQSGHDSGLQCHRNFRAS